jgi:hypothetical protein
MSDPSLDRHAIAENSGVTYVMGCTGKRAYRRGSDAKRAIKSAKAQGSKTLYRYWCTGCLSWHLSKQKQVMGN